MAANVNNIRKHTNNSHGPKNAATANAHGNTKLVVANRHIKRVSNNTNNVNRRTNNANNKGGNNSFMNAAYKGLEAVLKSNTSQIVSVQRPPQRVNNENNNNNNNNSAKVAKLQSTVLTLKKQLNNANNRSQMRQLISILKSQSALNGNGHRNTINTRSALNNKNIPNAAKINHDRNVTPAKLTVHNKLKNTNNLSNVEQARKITLQANPYFYTMHISKLMTYLWHSEAYVRAAAKHVISTKYLKQHDIEKNMSNKQKLVQYLDSVHKGNNMPESVPSLTILKIIPSRFIPTNQKPLPLSGGEFRFDPEIFTSRPELLKSINCLRYALGKYNIVHKHKLNPTAMLTNKPDLVDRIDLKYKNSINNGDPKAICKKFGEKLAYALGFTKKVINANGKTEIVPDLERFQCKADEKLDRNHYKIAVIMAITKDPHSSKLDYSDFHVLRQLSSGVWGHKRGSSTACIAVDAANQLILDVRFANFNYDERLNYSTFCSYYRCPRSAAYSTKHV